MNIKSYTYLLILLFIGFSTYLVFSTFNRSPVKTERDKAQSIEDAFRENFEMTKDPALGYPPVEQLLAAVEQARHMQAEIAARNARDEFEGIRWKEKGPSNIGGRTRTILVDSRDPEGRIVWAGGVAGGLWKTEDITANPPVWNKINDFLENMAVGAIAQDPNNPEIMYAGTGEGYFSTSAVAGLGIFKSVDGGDTWDLLQSTLSGNDFERTQDMLVHPSGDVYAATLAGLFRSEDGGASWVEVIPFGVDFYDLDYVPTNNSLYVSNRTAIYRSETGDSGSWDYLGGFGSGWPGGLSRVEMAVSHSNPDIIYMIANKGGGASPVYVTNDGGESWAARSTPSNNDGSEFTNGQAWYDLDLAVHPTNPGFLIAGGVPIMYSEDGGLTWQRFANSMHVDQHVILFDEVDPNTILFGNDGGVYRSTNNVIDVPADKNNGYNVTQFYACALHPDAFSNYMLGGTQDNNSLQLNNFGITTARSVLGGDGIFCHIDQNEPNIQIVSFQRGNYSLSTNGGRSFESGANVNGSFLNRSDYDNDANIMYAQTNDGDFYRWNINTAAQGVVDVSNADFGFVSAITADPNTDNRIYFGNSDGALFVVDDAHTGDAVTAQSLSSLNGNISCIEVENGDPQHLLVTISNYGLASVFESKDGGGSWSNVEGNLPNMPVRWCIFNPNNAQQAMVATEAGVWTTEILDGGNTEWIPPMPDAGIPLVRTDMLQVRESDNVVLAATHGRGLWTTDIFADPTVRINYHTVAYTEAPVQFYGEHSYRAEFFDWTFGDGTSSMEENPVYAYSNPGAYDVNLKVSDNLQESGDIKILPDLPVPYTEEASDYGGNLEGMPEQFGVHTTNGSSFELGQSSIEGKNGTHSGDKAFVLGLNEEEYQENTQTYLYTSNFDLSEPSIYEFSFWAKYRIQPIQDGFLVQYSTDKGQSWKLLGSANSPNWYNYYNENRSNAAFSPGTSYFTNVESEWTEYKINISGFSGNENVAFRFVFRSEASGSYPGLAIDDIKVTNYNGELRTQLLNFTGEYSSSSEITLNWVTEPEYYCFKFELERSFDGLEWEEIASPLATGGITTARQNYSETTDGIRSLYFFRLKVINQNSNIDYFEEFYSDILILRKGITGTNIFRYYPNPFRDQVNLIFDDFIEGSIQYEIFDTAGRLLSKSAKEVGGINTTIYMPSYLSPGTYFLQITIGDQEPEVLKLLKKG